MQTDEAARTAYSIFMLLAVTLHNFKFFCINRVYQQSDCSNDVKKHFSA